MTDLKFKSQDIYTFLLFSGIWLLFYIFNMLGTYPVLVYKLVFYFMLAVNGTLILSSIRFKNPIGLLFFGYITLYMIPYISVLNRDVYLSIYLKEKDFQLLSQTLLIYSLFLLPFLLFNTKNSIMEIKIDTVNNEILFYVLLLVFLFMWHFGIQGQNIFVSGGYGSGNQKKSSIYEYLLIIICLIYQYSGKSKRKMLIFYLFCILYIGKNLLFGGRIETLMLIIMVYLLVFQNKIPFRMLIIFAGIFYYLMQVFSNMRSNLKALVTGDYLAVFNIFNSSSNIDYLGTNEGDVFWAGERLLYLIRDGYLTVLDRITSGLSFFLSVFVPRSLLGGYDNLASFKRNVYGTGGGGLAPLFFYTMFSIVGVFLIGYTIAKLFNGITKKYSLKNIYILFMIVTLPRWFAYYPIQLIKLDLIAVVVIYFFHLISSFLCKYCKCSNNIDKYSCNKN